ncbi:MAG: FAD-dependent oxidoreductase [Bdellovibrionota bacterium]
MFAKKLKCTVIKRDQLSPTVFRIFFKANRRLKFRAGQFVSVQVGKEWRCYSFANSPEDAEKNGYELCIKEVPGGKGSTYLSGLKAGDTFVARAPFGHYSYRQSDAQAAVFIATGTGIAPIRSILQSEEFKKNRPANVYVITGYRTESEILYRGELEALGAQVFCALSQPTRLWIGMRGRVTDVLRNLPQEAGYYGANFYVCGAGAVVQSVTTLLRNVLRIPQQQIVAEAFSRPTCTVAATAPAELKPMVVNG